MSRVLLPAGGWVPADPVLDPYRPQVPTVEVFGIDFTGPVGVLLSAVWGGFIVFAFVRLFSSLAAAGKAKEAGDADSLVKATKEFRAAVISLSLLFGAAIIVGAYVIFANTIINTPGS